MTGSPTESREQRRADLTELRKRELAEMLCSTFRPSMRPTVAQVMNSCTKLRIINRLLDIPDLVDHSVVSGYTSTEDLLIALRNWLDDWQDHGGMESDRRAELVKELLTALTHGGAVGIRTPDVP